MTMEYLDYIKIGNKRDKIARQTADYLAEHLQFSGFVLCKHYPTPQPLEVLENYDDSFNVNNWNESCRKNPPKIDSLLDIYHANYHYIFLNQDYTADTSYFIISTNEPSDKVMETIIQWNRLDQYVSEINRTTTEQQTEKYGNLISQLLHDVETLTRMQSNQESKTNLTDRLDYQQKVNDNLLVYLRPLDILNSDLQVEDLLSSSLQLIGLDLNNFSVTYQTTPANISIDPEMFARALNEIVLNAMQAVEFDMKKCKITINQIQSPSPLILKNWLTVEVDDLGHGISEEYLIQIKEPFFTTRKNEGHSGFGLSIADKILTTIGGFLDISSKKGNGTKAIIYLPIKYD